MRRWAGQLRRLALRKYSKAIDGAGDLIILSVFLNEINKRDPRHAVRAHAKAQLTALTIDTFPAAAASSSLGTACVEATC